MIRRPPRSPLFPYTPLSRSHQVGAAGLARLGLHGPVIAEGVAQLERVELLGEADAVTHIQARRQVAAERSEEHTSELQSQSNLVCRLLLEKKKKKKTRWQNTSTGTRTLSSPWRCQLFRKLDLWPLELDNPDVSSTSIRSSIMTEAHRTLTS